MIEVARLVRRFGALVAVDDISFELAKGEVVGFLGPNGAGKTTTMRMLTGFLPATSAGVMKVAGFDVLRQSLEVRKHIGYLPESVPLYRELRVREMMEFQGRLHGMPRAELKTKIPAVLDRVGVLDRDRQLVGKLSRGLRQRVGIAVALLPDPDVLILDEPTSGLDPLQRREVRSLLRSLAEEHTVLLSSHILAEVEDLCPRVIVIHNGALVADGTQDQLIERFGGAGCVRLEAAVGPDVAEAIRLMGSLPGITRVDDAGKLGIHHGFEIHGEGDVREDIGALAMQKGWALRELSWDRPTLEELFARLVLGGGVSDRAAPGDGISSTSGAAPDANAPGVPPGAGLQLAVDTAPPGTGGADKKVLYSLNPFDRGAGRALDQPMEIGGDDGPGDGGS